MMTNKERYKQAFSAVQSSRQLCLEVEEMARIEKKHKKNIPRRQIRSTYLRIKKKTMP
jgi:hypothetical protein